MLKDADIREPLFDFLEKTYGKVRILEEKIIGSSRADVMMVVPEGLYGIEIKSDADSYTRLAGQVKDYDKYYDFNMVAVGTSHAGHIEEHVPEYWGIITVEETAEGPDFYLLRKARPNPKMRWIRKLEILWRPELAAFQEMNAMPKYRQESKAFVIGKIAERIEKGKIDEQTARTQISSLLFERDYTAIKKTISNYKKAEAARPKRPMDPVVKLKLMVGNPFFGGFSVTIRPGRRKRRKNAGSRRG